VARLRPKSRAAALVSGAAGREIGAAGSEMAHSGFGDTRYAHYNRRPMPFIVRPTRPGAMPGLSPPQARRIGP